MKEYDIVIVGAGPAGTSAAYFSKFFDKENQVDVLLLEQLSGERYSDYHHMCGECISSKAFEELDPIEPKNVVEKIELIKEFVVDEFVIEREMEGYVIDRPKFFSQIINRFENMGGEVKRERVGDIKSKENKVSLKTDSGRTIETRYLIGADGANSTIRKTLNWGGVQTRLLFQYILDKEPEHGVLKFFYDERYEGDYKWEFPNGNLTKIGFPYIEGKNFDVKGNIIKKQSRLVAHGGIENRVKGNVLLVGDAAGQTNSLSKGGFRAAMYAGKKAAESIIIYESPEKYEEAWKKSIFHQKLTSEVFERLKKMSNEEIIEHLEPFRSNNLLKFLRILFFKKYWKYWDIYSGYLLEERAGW